MVITKAISLSPKEPVPVKKVENPHAIARPHATPLMLQRQGSFRVFQHLSQVMDEASVVMSHHGPEGCEVDPKFL